MSRTESKESSTFLGLDDGRRFFLEGFAKEIRPKPELTCDQWADQFRIVSAKASSEAGPWRTERTEYLREIMFELSVSSSTSEINFMKQTQIGGTEVILNWIGYIIDYAPGPVMVVWPTSNTAKRNSKQRLTPLVSDTPALKSKVAEARKRDSGNTTLMKEFVNGVLVIAGANSTAELKSMPIKFLAEDEIDEYPDDLDGQGDPGKLAEKRTTNFPRHKIYKCSSPTVEGFSKIAIAYEASDQRHYNVPCPSCDEYQVLEWDQVRWTTNKRKEFICFPCGVVSPGEGVSGKVHVCPECDEESAVSAASLIERETNEIISVFYECVYCGYEIGEHNKTEMLSRGRWVAVNPGPDRAAGFHINALYSPLGWYSWRNAVKDYLEALNNEVLMKVFENTVLAKTYVDKTAERPDINLVREMAEGYRLGIVQPGGLLLIATVDVQVNRLEVKLKAWGRNEESWLVEYHVIHGDPDDDSTWQSLDDYITKSFEHELGGTLKIAAVGVDSGYKTQRVYDFCRKSKHRHAIPLKGMPNDGRAILGSPTKQDINYKGERIKHGIKLWPVGTFAAKSLVYGRLKPKIDQETGEEVERPDKMHFPVGLPETYFDQLTAESLLTIYNKSGHARREWRKKPNDRNEALDLEVYNIATAIYVGLKRMNWDRLEKKLNLVQKDLFANKEQNKDVPETVVEDVPEKKTSKRSKKKRRPRGSGYVGRIGR